MAGASADAAGCPSIAQGMTEGMAEGMAEVGSADRLAMSDRAGVQSGVVDGIRSPHAESRPDA
jgi:hypothetical protein